jgi:magnesium-transporting ATPase (P-type)
MVVSFNFVYNLIIRFQKQKFAMLVYILDVEEEISSEQLVPGDIILIKNMTCMQCDALILDGNVLVDESMLTGESTPTAKVEIGTLGMRNTNDPLANARLNIKEHNRHILFSGTNVLQVRTFDNRPIKAIVIRTGFSTTKGSLVRSILYPKPVDFRFNNDTYVYVFALAVLAVCGVTCVVFIRSMKIDIVPHVVVDILDLLTTAVPPGKCYTRLYTVLIMTYFLQVKNHDFST